MHAPLCMCLCCVCEDGYMCVLVCIVHVSTWCGCVCARVCVVVCGRQHVAWVRVYALVYVCVSMRPLHMRSRGKSCRSRQTPIYLTVNQANQPVFFFPQEAGGHWWISRGRLRASGLSLTLKRLLESSCEWRAPACAGLPPHAPLAWGLLSHTIMSSLLPGCPCHFSPF